MSDVSVDLPHAFLFEYSRTGMPSLFNGLAHLRLLTRIEISPRTCGSSFVGLFLHSCATAPESARPGNITLVWKLLKKFEGKRAQMGFAFGRCKRVPYIVHTIDLIYTVE
ncbi:hypothetical protein BD310DRAFT_937048 [Dichomitus squalens]|uniref:Uncharacterized protein n=1 Tax=Dichomitus squalens TaxID=114155 RepID=A0A4Q9PIS4_9APHY|nr:hypothetical protein BD310DRAFT_937048 [Dichomitus squalens]